MNGCVLLALLQCDAVDGPVHCPLPNGHCAWSILPVGGANGYWRQAALAVFWVQADIAVSGLLTRKAALSATLRAELFCESRAWLLPRSSMRRLRDHRP